MVEAFITSGVLGALGLPGGQLPPAGYEIIPKPDARALAAYLLSLRADAPIFVTPMSVPVEAAAAGTNAPATNAMPSAVSPTSVPSVPFVPPSTNAPAAPATNPAPK